MSKRTTQLVGGILLAFVLVAVAARTLRTPVAPSSPPPIDVSAPTIAAGPTVLLVTVTPTGTPVSPAPDGSGASDPGTDVARAVTQATQVSAAAVPIQAPARLHANASLRPLPAGAEAVPLVDGALPALDAAARQAAFVAAPGVAVTDYANVYVADLDQETLRAISVDAEQQPGDSWSGAPAISWDGLALAFYSWAGNLVEDDTNRVRDAFLADLESGEIIRISEGAGGEQANDRSGSSGTVPGPALSGDGRLIAYFSDASNLVEGDTNGVADVFVYARETGQSRRVSVAVDGSQGDGPSTSVALSGDGTLVAFQSEATNLLGPTVAPAPGHAQIYLLDRDAATLQLASHSASRDGISLYANAAATHPLLSADGNFLAFVSAASNLVPNDLNGVADIFILDLRTDQMERVSIASSGSQANGASYWPALSAGGRFVAFVSAATNLVDGDRNGLADIFVHDRLTRQTQRLVDGANAAQQTPALDAGGLTVAFSSAATNLLESPARAVPHLYLHRREPPQTYMIQGAVLDSQSLPVADVLVRAGPQSAMTDSRGVYTLTHLLEGTYTVFPEKSGFAFGAPRRIASVSPDWTPGPQDFVAYANGSPATPFLDLPLIYDGSEAAFLRILQDREVGGRIVSWFDHRLPLQTADRAIVLWDGRTVDGVVTDALLGCYEQRCYDGHSGIDFPFRDLNFTSPPLRDGVISVFSAAAGVVVEVVEGCTVGETRCGDGFGNYVVVNHRNGYFTLYGHLAVVKIGLDARVTLRDELGTMGNTGRSTGTHLHFGVYRDDDNGIWDGWEIDLPVDPFGWSGIQPDPWVSEGGGPVSHWLWRYAPQRATAFLGSEGAVLTEPRGDVQVRVAPAAFRGQVRMTLAEAAISDVGPGLRLAAAPISASIVEWLEGGEQLQQALAGGDINAVQLEEPLEVVMRYGAESVRHLEQSALQVARWLPAQQRWALLPSQVDVENRLVTAMSPSPSTFALRAPLRCAAEEAEPDDDHFSASALTIGEAVSRVMDVTADEDWFWVDAVAGQELQLVASYAPTARVQALEIVADDGLTVLATFDAVDGAEGVERIEANWPSSVNGRLYIRVLGSQEEAAGCGDFYVLRWAR